MKNCKDLEKYLPLYPDDLPSGSDKQSVEEHLKSCPQCAITLAQLRKTEKLVQNLADVEPPPWFKQKIMARVREENEKKSLAQKWFYPSRIKIPVQIFATVFIAVLAVYIYRSGDQMKEVLPLSAPPVTQVQEKQSPEQKLQSTAKESVSLKDHSIQKKEAPGKQTRKKEAAPSLDAKQEVAADMKVDKSASAPSPAAKSAEIMAGELEKKKDSVLGSAMKAGRTLKEQSVTVSPNVLLKVADTDSASVEVGKLLIKYEAKNIARQSKPGKIILTADLKKQHINDLTVQLKTIGLLEERFLPTDNTAANITVVIEIYQ